MLTKPALLALYTPMFVFVIMVHRRRRRIVPGSSRNDMFPDVRMHDIHYAFSIHAHGYSVRPVNHSTVRATATRQ